MCYDAHGKYREPTKEEQLNILDQVEKRLEERLAEIRKAKQALQAEQMTPSGAV